MKVSFENNTLEGSEAKRLLVLVLLGAGMIVGVFGAGPPFLNKLASMQSKAPHEEGPPIAERRNPPDDQGKEAGNPVDSLKIKAPDGTNNRSTPPNQRYVEIPPTPNPEGTRDSSVTEVEINQQPLIDRGESLADEKNDPDLTDPLPEDTSKAQPVLSPDPVTDEEPEEEPVPSSREIFIQSAQGVAESLELALTSGSWSDVPKPVMDFYKNIVDGYKGFRVTNAEVLLDNNSLQYSGLTAELQAIVEIELQERGKEKKNIVAIPSTWFWHDQQGELTLYHVDG